MQGVLQCLALRLAMSQDGYWSKSFGVYESATDKRCLLPCFCIIPRRLNSWRPSPTGLGERSQSD